MILCNLVRNLSYPHAKHAEGFVPLRLWIDLNPVNNKHHILLILLHYFFSGYDEKRVFRWFSNAENTIELRMLGACYS